MKFVIFGLTVSSSWGNGHATLWRGLLKALIRRGHRIVFYERDVPWYADARDMAELPGGDLRLYRDWQSVRKEAERNLADADVAMVTSYCPDGEAASELVLSSRAVRKTFYDLDTPVTLKRLAEGERVPYLPEAGLSGFDLVFSYTGGRALDLLSERLGARRTVPLYGHADPETHRPVPALDAYRADLSYLGTWAPDRQTALVKLFVEPSRLLSSQKFLIGGAQYPQDFPWTANMYFARHLPPSEHPAFFSSSRLTLNITREAMAELGYCPSGRLFEAASCRTPVVSDWWEGIDTFFTPGEEILIARSTEDVLDIMTSSDFELGRVADAGFERMRSLHTSEHRAEELEAALADG